MTSTHLIRYAISTVMALGAGLAGPPASQAQAAGACMAPRLMATIDVAGSKPLSPRIVLSASDLSLPASGDFDWGNGEYGVARLGGGLDVDTVVQPIYQAAGTYTVTMVVTDACGAETTLRSVVTVPMRLPATAAVICPVALDSSGYCVVELGARSTFTLRGAANADWHWNAPGSADARGTSMTRALTIDTPRPTFLQATAITAKGWLVTPVLRVVGLAPAPPRITDFSDPGTAPAGQPIAIAFTVPSGASGLPSIYVDDGKVADDDAATIRLTPGSHTITYVLEFPDGAAQRRQTIIVATAAVPWLPIGAACAGVLALIGLLAVSVGRTRRARTARKDHDRPAMDAPPGRRHARRPRSRRTSP